MADQSFTSQLLVNQICHTNHIPFISTSMYPLQLLIGNWNSCGIYGNVFCDFGKEFVVDDKDGEPTQFYAIHHISKGKKTSIEIADDQREYLAFEIGDIIRFDKLQGMTELNGVSAEIVSCGRTSFVIDHDTTTYGEYTFGGYAIPAKVAITKSFVSYIK
jgi:hypothetical protein